jgi:hypothetical protein
MTMMRALQIFLGVALLASLILAGAKIYRRLPATSAEANQTIPGGAQRDVTVVFQAAVSFSEARVRLYPIDYAAAERDYLSNRRSGKSFEDFLAMRLKNVTAVNVNIDNSGRGVARVSEGNWWMHVVSARANGESMEWRLPLTIGPRPQTIELSLENAYERSKTF